jgi:hypothetical protein
MEKGTREQTNVSFSILDTSKKNNFYRYVFKKDEMPFIAIRTRHEFRKFLRDNKLKVLRRHDRLFNIYYLDKKIEDRLIWNLDQIEDIGQAVPYLGLSNGSIVTCYRVVKDDKVIWYRPNANSKLYNPLPHKTHMQYTAEKGIV